MAIATCGPALAGIIVSAVSRGQGKLQLWGNRRRWIIFLIAQLVCSAIALAHNHFINGAPLAPVIYLAIFSSLRRRWPTSSAPFTRGERL